jgi:hypothetical protein
MKRPAKKYPVRCVNKRCRGFVASKHCHTNKCARCKIRAWNERHPLARAFHNLRSHAKERGKDFSLTFEQFRSFALNTDYMSRKGKSSISFQIDRKDDSKGYCASNIQCISLRENMRKQFVPYFQNYIEETMDETKKQIQEAYGL